MNPLNERYYALQDKFMDRGFYSADLFTEFRQLQQEAFQAEFDVHRLTLEVEHLRAENTRLEVAKAMLEPDREYTWVVEQKLGLETLHYEHMRAVSGL